MTRGRCKIGSVTARSSIRSDIPSCRQRGSRISGAIEARPSGRYRIGFAVRDPPRQAGVTALLVMALRCNEALWPADTLPFRSGFVVTSDRQNPLSIGAPAQALGLGDTCTQCATCSAREPSLFDDPGQSASRNFVPLGVASGRPYLLKVLRSNPRLYLRVVHGALANRSGVPDASQNWNSRSGFSSLRRP
jgi:hypothetical protein